MACPWRHVAASDAACQSADLLQASDLLRCDQPGCEEESPVSYWHLEGPVVELAGASEEALAELSRLTPAQRKRIEARLSRAPR
jgi:hypothetical protein